MSLRRVLANLSRSRFTALPSTRRSALSRPVGSSGNGKMGSSVATGFGGGGGAEFSTTGPAGAGSFFFFAIWPRRHRAVGKQVG